MNNDGNYKAHKGTDFHRELKCTGSVDIDIIDTYDSYLEHLRDSLDDTSILCSGFKLSDKCFSYGSAFIKYAYEVGLSVLDKKRILLKVLLNAFQFNSI